MRLRGWSGRSGAVCRRPFVPSLRRPHPGVHSVPVDLARNRRDPLEPLAAGKTPTQPGRRHGPVPILGTGSSEISDRQPTPSPSRRLPLPESSPLGVIGPRHRGRGTAAVARPCATRWRRVDPPYRGRGSSSFCQSRSCPWVAVSVSKAVMPKGVPATTSAFLKTLPRVRLKWCGSPGSNRPLPARAVHVRSIVRGSATWGVCAGCAAVTGVIQRDVAVENDLTPGRGRPPMTGTHLPMPRAWRMKSML